ncbi:DUF3857 and transglutaminase domain-containing protein [bacterium]|nr:DUF3857 and transglutaminase domain-containing protein [bacterium]
MKRVLPIFLSIPILVLFYCISYTTYLNDAEASEKSSKEIQTKTLDGAKDGYLLKILKNDSRYKKYEPEGALIVLKGSEVWLNEDGTYVYEYHQIRKVFKTKDADSAATQEIGYDPRYEKIELLQARTIRPDGTYQNVSPATIKDVAISSYTHFNGKLKKLLVFPSLKENTYFELKYRTQSNYKDIRGVFEDLRTLGSGYPIINCRYKIHFPTKLGIKYRVRNGDGYIAIKEEHSDDQTIVTFSVKNEKGLVISEKYRPVFGDIKPILFISSLRSFKQFTEWYNSNTLEQRYEINDNISGVVNKFKKQADGDKEKLTGLLYHWILENLNYVSLGFGVGHKIPRRAIEIFKSGYGDCKDGTTLLVAMLRHAGVAANPVLIRTDDLPVFPENFPTMMWNHMIAGVEIDDKLILLDTTETDNAYPCLSLRNQGRQALIMYPDNSYRYLVTNYLEPEFNKEIKYKTITIDQEGNAIYETKSENFGCMGNDDRWLTRYTEEELKKYFEKEYLDFGDKLISYEISGLEDRFLPLTLSYKVKSKKYAEKIGNLFILQPQGRDITAFTFLSFPDRIYDLHGGQQKQLEDHYILKIQHNYKVKFPPKTVELDNKYFYFERAYTYDEKNSVISIDQVYKKKTNIVKAKEYKKFRQSYEQILDMNVYSKWVLEEIE